jgi:triosephosphate isomerase
LEKTSIQLGAQNMGWAKEGAFTGEISPHMLRDLYVTHVILGHSERRTIFGETLEQIRMKVEAALTNGLVPILCVGETLEEREAGQQDGVVRKQLGNALEKLSLEQIERMVIAYEPVWAIGTGKTATPKTAQEMHGHIRRMLAQIGGQDLANRVRILYGGSMKPSNCGELLIQPDIDGGLIGSASLDPLDFIKIVEAACKV